MNSHDIPGSTAGRSGLLKAALSAALVLTLTPDAFAAKLAGWDFNGLSGYGASPLAATNSGPGITVGGLTRGNGITTLNQAAANAWGGNGWDGPTDLASAASTDHFATFTLTPTTGPMSLGSISGYNIRRSNSGPATGQWQYSLDGTTFVNIGESLTWGSVTSATGNSQQEIPLGGIAALQNIPVGTTVTFRVANWGATGAGGNWYFNNFQAGDDLVINSTDTTLAIDALSPADNALDVAASSLSQLTITFSKDIALGTGLISLKKVSDGSVVQTFDASDLGAVDLNGRILGLLLTAPLSASTEYYVEIPSTAILDTEEPPNAFPGISGATTWNFTTAAPAAAPSIVINKLYNSGNANGAGDIVELLVVGDETPAAPRNLVGTIIKDFSSNGSGDNGGRYQFTDNTLWDDLPTGTLVVLTKSGDTTDTDTSDFVVRVGLDDTAYFTRLGTATTFDLSGTELLVVKAAGSDVAGMAGTIHAFGYGDLAAGTFFDLYPGAKVKGSVPISSGQTGYVNNTTSTLADYVTGSDVTSGVLPLSMFGLPNNSANASFIFGLRGQSFGDGSATLVNTTADTPFASTSIFGRGQTAQSVEISVQAQAPTTTLNSVTITVPVDFGAPGTVTLSGAGLGGGSHTVSGQQIQITGAAVTGSNPLVVSISGLSTPAPAAVTDNGNYAFTVATASTGAPAAILASPRAHVLIPIASLRDVTASGVSADLGATVAVEGVVTEEDFGNGSSNFSGFIQDSTAGINVFSPGSENNPNFVRGNRYAVLGSILQFNGLTEIAPASSAQVISLGAATEVAPETVTLAALLAGAEAYEGKLVRVENLTYVSGEWGSGATVVLKDGAGQELDIRIQPGSTATTAPTYPVSITGIFGQFDSSSPFDSGYQLMPRDMADLAGGTASDYDLWAAANGVTEGAAGDDDKDGRTNRFEYLFGLDPQSAASTNPFTSVLNKATGQFSYTRRTGSGVPYSYEYSTTLSGAWQPLTPASEVVTPGTPVETVTVTVPAALLSETRLFIRVSAE